MSLEFSLVEKCHARFIKKISQLKSDIRSCRCKNFRLKVVSVRSDRGSRPPGPSPWIRHRKLPNLDFDCSVFCSEDVQHLQSLQNSLSRRRKNDIRERLRTHCAAIVEQQAISAGRSISSYAGLWKSAIL